MLDCQHTPLILDQRKDNNQGMQEDQKTKMAKVFFVYSIHVETQPRLQVLLQDARHNRQKIQGSGCQIEYIILADEKIVSQITEDLQEKFSEIEDYQEESEERMTRLTDVV